MSKLDFADAFHHILVQPDQWILLGSSFERKDNSGDPITEIFLSTVLPFGLHSSPALFTDFAYATNLIMLKHGVTECEHFLDDNITVRPPNSDSCASNLEIMLTVCKDVGFDVKPNKIVLPTPVIEFLCIILDTEKLEFHISNERLQSTMSELDEWRHCKRAWKRNLLSLRTTIDTN